MTIPADLVHFASDAAFAIDGSLRVVAWNCQAEAMFGYTAPEVLGRPCYAVLRAVLPDGRPLCTPRCPAKGAFVHGAAFAAARCLVHRRDGARVDVGLSSLALGETFPGDQALALVLVRPLEVSAPTSGVPVLRLFTLGHFRIVAGDTAIATGDWERKQPLTLLKYLAAHRGRAVHRDRLIECLWPDASEKQGRERLKVAVHFLRRELRRAGLPADVVGTVGEAYVLYRDLTWVDADAFDHLVTQGDALRHQGRAAEALRCYAEATELYRGDYLQEDIYADWCAGERERLRERFLDLLTSMADLHAAQGQYPQAIHACRLALAREPCRESVHRALMTYLWRQGRRDDALAQYRTCAEVLAREFGVEPLPETQRLYHRILQEVAAASPSATP